MWGARDGDNVVAGGVTGMLGNTRLFSSVGRWAEVHLQSWNQRGRGSSGSFLGDETLELGLYTVLFAFVQSRRLGVNY